MADKIKLYTTISTLPDRIFKAWLNSREHGLFTGSAARISSKVGGKFMAWNGYISGENIFIKQNERIIQSWRTTDFPESSPDSKLEIIFQKVVNGTRITIIHSEIPTGQGEEYKKGWKDFYFKPMKKYFEKT